MWYSLDHILIFIFRKPIPEVAEEEDEEKEKL